MPRHLHWIVLAAAASVLVAAVLIYKAGEPGGMPAARLVSTPAAAVESARVPAATPLPTPAASPAPDPQATALAIAAVEQALATGSLRDSTPDGAIEVDASGRLRLNLALKRWFDWHLSLVGEVPPQSIRAWVADHLSRTRPAAVRDEVLRAFDAYLAYLADVDRVARMQQQADPAERLQLLKDLRRQHLGSDLADAFFGDEEHYGDYTLAQRALQRDDTLTPAQRQAKLAALEAELPESVRQPLAQHRQVEADLARSAEIAAGSSDPVTRFAEREQAFGAEAAARLEQLDQEQSDWQRRLSGYAAARRAVLADQALDAAAREARLLQLRASQFDATERARVEALEQVGALPAE